ncbi:Phytochrome-like protein cph2 [Ureibacillus acetophenoni]
MQEIERKTSELQNVFDQKGEQINFPFFITNPNIANEPIVYVNPMFTKLIDVRNDEVIGESKETFLHSNFHFKTIDGPNEFELNNLQEQTHVEIYKKDGFTVCFNYTEHKLIDNSGKHIYTLSVLININKYKEEIVNLSFYDPISKLPNYHYFLEHINKLIDMNSKGFILTLQPGDYCQIADTFGRQQISLLHKELYKRVQDLLKDIPSVIALTSEGTIVVAGQCDENDMKKYVDQIVNIVNQPFTLDEIELFITLKVGVNSLNEFTSNIDECVRQANIALSYSRKKAGNSITYFEKQFSTDLKEKILIQNELVLAIRKRDIKVFLQPKVNIVDEKIVSFEALARWNSPKFGQIPPVVFIEAAESIGMIEDLDFLIIEQVLEWLLNRKQSNLPLYQVSVNISPSHFYSENFIEKLREVVNRYGINPRYIKIELTENIGLVDLKRAKQIINDLKLEGFESSVDDFGIGFSSLSYLHQLPVNELKIDRSFINNINDNGGSAIVKTIIELARSINLTAVAEGIESEEQLEFIREMSCNVAQGYYFYKPMTLEKVDELLI